MTYSHGDVDGDGASRLRQWSQGFARELESELRVFPQFGRELRVFVDHHHRLSQGIDPMEPLTEQLRSEIERSAVLLVLMSPHYLASTWCADERDWWWRKQEGFQVPHQGRVAVARIWPTSDPWPATLGDERGEALVGFWFYDRVQADVKPQPFGWPEPGPQTGDPFRRALLELVGRLRLKLEELRKRLDEQRKAREQADRLQASSGQVVYLHGRAEFSDAWNDAANELANRGMVVVPSEPDPVVRDAQELQRIRQRRIETLSACDALLLLGSAEPRAVDADLVVVGRQDRNSARALSNHPLPCALLDNIGDALSTPRRRVVARSLNVTWIDGTRHSWLPAVQEWLATAAREGANP